MIESAQKSLFFISALALSLITIQLIPFSREKELSNYCREYYALTKEQGFTIAKGSIDNTLSQIVSTISKKSGLKTRKQIHNLCHSFYLNQ